MTQTVIGIFRNTDAAQNAVDKLLSSGFSDANVDIASDRSLNYTTHKNEDEHESGIARFFKNLFGDDDDERERYTKAAERGTVVTVYAQTKEEAERAASLLDEYGAIDVNEDYGQYDDYNTDDTYRQKRYTDEENGKTIPVIEENLQVGKKEVQTGGVRLKSRIIEKPVEENLRLREEHVRVERNTVDRPATDADFNEFKEGSIEITEHKEVPVVSKEARVVEEVSLAKEVEHRKETVRDTVRKTEVDMEELEKDKKDRTI